MNSAAAAAACASAPAWVVGGGAGGGARSARGPCGIRVCGLGGEAVALRSLRISQGAAVRRAAVAARAAAENGVAGSGGFDYDLVIIGAGVGGHGAALHAVEEVSADHVYCSV